MIKENFPSSFPRFQKIRVKRGISWINSLLIYVTFIYPFQWLLINVWKNVFF